MLLSYNICNVFAIVSSFLVMSGVSPAVAYAGNCLYYFCYFYINGMMFCCVVERLAATVLMKTYEYNRRWWTLVLSQPFAVSAWPFILYRHMQLCYKHWYGLIREGLQVPAQLRM